MHFQKVPGSFIILSESMRKSSIFLGFKILFKCTQDKGASIAVEAPQASDSEVNLGGLPICRSLTRRKSMPNRAPAPPCTHPPSRGGPAHDNPAAAAAAAAAMSFINHGQRSRRQSRLIMPSSVPTMQVDTYTDYASLRAYYKGRQSRLIMPSSVLIIQVDSYTDHACLRAYCIGRQSEFITPPSLPTA